MRHITLGGAAAAAAGLGAISLALGVVTPSAAWAGTTLVSRDSNIRAAGSGAFGEYDVGDGTADDGPFADMIDSADGGVVSPQASAQQHSLPGVAADGSLGGAWAEGWSRAWADAADPAGGSHAESNFGIVFRVTEADTRFALTGSLGASGAGWVGVQLTGDQDLPTQYLLVSEEVLPGRGAADPAAGQSIGAGGVLQPGTYGLWVMSTADGVPGALEEGASYYNVSLSLSAAPGPVAIPLPPAVWTGLGTLVVLGAGRLWGRRRRRHGR